MSFIPVLSSQAGSTLTMANWHEAGINRAAYRLSDLLMRPGFAFLKQLPNLKAFTGWQQTLILDATLPYHTERNIYRLKSRYDGTIIQLEQSILMELIQQLNPDEVLLAKENNDYIIDLQEDLPFEQLKKLIDSEHAIISNQPALDAVRGIIFTEEGALDLKQLNMAEQFLPLGRTCTCPTCSQGFTRAYLHHLLQHTPLLAQRFLVIHNVWYAHSFPQVGRE